MFGSFGYYYEQIPMDLVIRSFSFEQQPASTTSTRPRIVPRSEAEPRSAPRTSKSRAHPRRLHEPSDPDLKSQYISEFILGDEREVIPNMAVGVKDVYRDYGKVIEDFLCSDDGTYCIGNPGEGIMSTIFNLDYEPGFPAPKPERIYRGVQLDVTKRFADNW